MRRALTGEEAAALLASTSGLAALHAVHPGPRFTYLAVNQRAVEALGRDAESLVGVDVTDLFGPGATTQLAAVLERALATGEPVPFTTVVPFAGAPVVMDAEATAFVDDDGTPVQLLWAAVDTSEERAKKEALARSEARFRSLVDHAFDGVGVVDADGCYTWTSASLDRLLGLAPGSLLGRSALALVHPHDVAEAARQLSATDADSDAGTTWIGRARHASGEWRMLEVNGTDLRHDPDVGGVVLNVRDVSEHHRAEEALRASELEYRRLALHDVLTGLPNRSLFDDRVRQALARLERRPGSIAVLFCDLDGFKWLNDSYGHAHGDRIVVEIARRIRDAVRSSDTVARFGGDEFLVLSTDLRSADEAMETAARLLQAVREPITVADADHQLTVSIGVTVTDRSDASVDDLIAQADAAMYEAKDGGRDRVAAFDPSLQDRARRRVEMSAQLRQAIPDGRLLLHYQPLVSLHGGGVRGAEALVRWSHPERGLVPPGEFVPVAEDTGLMTTLGTWVLEEACATARSWGDDALRINVNLSPRQLADAALTDHVERVLRDTGLRPERLQLEVTEGAVMHDVVEAARSLGRLRDLGVRVGIDDFGTGHSSLAYLRQLPLDFLKIDRAFVTLLGQDARDEAIVGAIVDMAHALGLEAVAEGVETETQSRSAIELGCDVAQGWHFGRPAAAPGALWSPGRAARL